MTEVDQDRTEIDSRLLVSSCDANSFVLHLFLANYGKVEQKYRLLVEQGVPFVGQRQQNEKIGPDDRWVDRRDDGPVR
jgi:hypothetical protein